MRHRDGWALTRSSLGNLGGRLGDETCNDVGLDAALIHAPRDLGLGFTVWGLGFLVYLEGAHVAPVLVPRVGHKPVVLALKMRGKVSRNWTLMVQGWSNCPGTGP